MEGERQEPPLALSSKPGALGPLRVEHSLNLNRSTFHQQLLPKKAIAVALMPGDVCLKPGSDQKGVYGYALGKACSRLESVS